MSELIEPTVLAAAKDYLLPSDSESGYAVVDSQFRVDKWGNTDIPTSVRERLQPVNALQLAVGNPDALIAPPSPDTFRGTIDDSVTSLPLAVLEAKGTTSTETPNYNRNMTRIAITQAHAHLGETNIGFAAVPQRAISETDQALSRELNIGLLAVDINESVTLLEKARLVGTETTPTTETIRFHAQLGETTIERLTKNHPKNALGYALATLHKKPTESIFREYVIDSINDARRDAEALGLVVDGVPTYNLTPIGQEALRTIIYHYDGIEPALEAIKNERGSPRRFITSCPIMGAVAREVLLEYPPTKVLIDTIEEVMDRGDTPTLGTVAKAVATKRPNFAVDLFVSTQREDRERVFSDEDSQVLDLGSLDIGEIYSTHTTFQYKAMLFHTGLLTQRGEDTKAEIDPDTDLWKLETPIE